MINICADVSCSPFEMWSTYMACTLHFKKGSKYDAFKFNFKGPRCKRETFMNHHQRYSFEKLATKYKNKNTAIEYFVSNLLEGNSWIGSMTDDAHARWTARVQSIDYIFSNNMKTALSHGCSFDDLFRPKENGEMPYIYDQYVNGSFPIETLVILNLLVGYTSRINKTVSDPLEMISDISNYIIAYTPFLRSKINVKKHKETVLNLFTYVHK